MCFFKSREDEGAEQVEPGQKSQQRRTQLPLAQLPFPRTHGKEKDSRPREQAEQSVQPGGGDGPGSAAQGAQQM